MLGAQICANIPALGRAFAAAESHPKVSFMPPGTRLKLEAEGQPIFLGGFRCFGSEKVISGCKWLHVETSPEGGLRLPHVFFLLRTTCVGVQTGRKIPCGPTLSAGLQVQNSMRDDIHEPLVHVFSLPQFVDQIMGGPCLQTAKTEGPRASFESLKVALSLGVRSKTRAASVGPGPELREVTRWFSVPRTRSNSAGTRHESLSGMSQDELGSQQSSILSGLSFETKTVSVLGEVKWFNFNLG